MDSERVVSEALRAQAAAGRPPPSGTGRMAPATGSRRPPPPPRPFPIGWVLMIALLVGAVVGVGLALISIFLPGALPVLSAG